MAVSASARGPQSRARLDRPLSRHWTWQMPASSPRKPTARARKYLVARAAARASGTTASRRSAKTPVVFIVVLAAQPVVVDTGDARPGHVDAHRGVLVRHDHRLLSLARHGARGRAADMGC